MRIPVFMFTLVIFNTPKAEPTQFRLKNRIAISWKFLNKFDHQSTVLIDQLSHAINCYSKLSVTLQFMYF